MVNVTSSRNWHFDNPRFVTRCAACGLHPLLVTPVTPEGLLISGGNGCARASGRGVYPEKSRACQDTHAYRRLTGNESLPVRQQPSGLLHCHSRACDLSLRVDPWRVPPLRTLETSLRAASSCGEAIPNWSAGDCFTSFAMTSFLVGPLLGQRTSSVRAIPFYRTGDCASRGREADASAPSQ